MSALTMALNLVNTATPKRLDGPQLRAALLDPNQPGQAQVRVLLEEAPRAMLLGLVDDGWITWTELALACCRVPHLGGSNAAWIGEMAGLALARPAR